MRHFGIRARAIGSALAIGILAASLPAPAAMAAATAAAAPPSAPRAAVDAGAWSLVHDVDLSDPSLWRLETGRAGNTGSVDRPENVSFGAEGLTIRTRFDGSASTGITSGDARGAGIPIPNYARVEVTGTMPYGAGVWPALLWLRPLNHPDGEIDLVEVFGARDDFAATVHTEYGPTHRQKQGSLPWASLPNPDPRAEHTFVMEKTPGRIHITADGVTLLDVTPADVPPGFDWNGVFEDETKLWYPRSTIQVGCGVDNPGCGLGRPPAGWRGGTQTLSSLRVWEWNVAEDVTLATPMSGQFDLAPGQERTDTHPAIWQASVTAGVTFRVPEDIGDAALYYSIDARSRENGRQGYRASTSVSARGALHLQLQKVVDGTVTVLAEKTVLPPGSYAPGQSIRLGIQASGDLIRARAYVRGAAIPGWQLNVRDRTPGLDAPGGFRAVAYLAGSADRPLTQAYDTMRAYTLTAP